MKQDISRKNFEIYSNNDEYFMEKAIKIARGALEIGEFPVGCIIEYKNIVIIEGVRSGTLAKKLNEIDHAEINALKKLYLLDKKYDYSSMTLYCTLEPCLMCFGAILLSGISRIVFAYEDIMGGGTTCDLSKLPSLYSNSSLTIIPGVLRDKSLNLFKLFFTNFKNTYWSNSKLSFYTIKQCIK